MPITAVTTDAIHKASCDAAVAAGDWIGVFTNTPNTSGSNEASGGGYARQQATYPTGAMDSGYWVRAASGVTFTLGNGTYKGAGNFTDSTSGTFRWAAPWDGGADVEISGSGGTLTVISTIRA